MRQMIYASDKDIANAENVARRHCRIGKLTIKKLWGVARPALPKHPKHYANAPILRVIHDWDEHIERTFGQQRKCSCPQGTVCGNVACPHLPIATC